MEFTSRMQVQFPGSRQLRQFRALWRSDRGQSLIELALLTPVLLILVVGLVEMGRYTSMSIQVSNAARAGAQYGAQNLAKAADANGIRCAAENESLSGGTAPACPSSNPLGLAVTFPAGPTTVCGCDNGGTISTMATCTSSCGQHVVVSVQVTAQGTFNPLFSYARPLFGFLTIPAITVTDTATERVAQ
jgi:Flp pilus assembly protein TadG